MTRLELTKRWKTSEGIQKLKQVIDCLTKSIPLSSISGLDKHEGRWDLRGAQLSKLESERKIKADGHSLSQKFGTLKIKNLAIESIDFSCADISFSWWEKCKLSNCLFEETKAEEVRIIASDFYNCIFRKTNFFYSYINENVGANSGSFKGVKFIETNLKECLFYFPLIEDCIFTDCNLEATNFNGSRFRNCKFKGKVNNSWFKGYPVNVHKSLLGIFNRINPTDYPNPMDNVDFTEADLIGVSFINGIDLSRCIFPNDENRYIVVRNLEKVYSQAKKRIKEEWVGEEKRKGGALIENIYYSKDRQDQSMDVIDKALLIDNGKYQDFGEKFFNLIKEINTELLILH